MCNAQRSRDQHKHAELSDPSGPPPAHVHRSRRTVWRSNCMTAEAEPICALAQHGRCPFSLHVLRIINVSAERDSATDSWRHLQLRLPPKCVAVAGLSAVHDRHAIFSPPYAATAQRLQCLHIYLVLLQLHTVFKEQECNSAAAF